MATKEKTQFVNSERYNSTQRSRNMKLVSLPLVPFTMRCFSIRPVEDLGKPHEYGYSKIKRPHKYKYSRIEEPHEYEYFSMEELPG